VAYRNIEPEEDITFSKSFRHFVGYCPGAVLRELSKDCPDVAVLKCMDAARLRALVLARKGGARFESQNPTGAFWQARRFDDSWLSQTEKRLVARMEAIEHEGGDIDQLSQKDICKPTR